MAPPAGRVLAVVAATLVVAAAGPDVAVVGPLPSGFPAIGLPDLGLSDLGELAPGAAAVALVAAADTLVSSRAFAVRNGYEVDADRDLIGLGAANLSSGVSGGITVSASAARTVVAESVGSRSQVAGLVAAALISLVLLVATGLLRDVPVAAGKTVLPIPTTLGVGTAPGTMPKGKPAETTTPWYPCPADTRP